MHAEAFSACKAVKKVQYKRNPQPRGSQTLRRYEYASSAPSRTRSSPRCSRAPFRSPSRRTRSSLRPAPRCACSSFCSAPRCSGAAFGAPPRCTGASLRAASGSSRAPDGAACRRWYRRDAADDGSASGGSRGAERGTPIRRNNGAADSALGSGSSRCSQRPGRPGSHGRVGL